jgi:hypothetical protein
MILVGGFDMWCIGRLIGEIGEERWREAEEKSVRYEAYEDCDGERDCAESDGYCPLGEVETKCGQSAGAEGNDEYLATYGDNVDAKEEGVAADTFEDVEFVIEAAVAGEM